MRLRRLLVPSGSLASVAIFIAIVSPLRTSCNNVTSAAAPVPAGALTAERLVRFFESNNWSPNASAGIVGNMAQEDSGFDPKAAGGGLVQNIGTMWTQQVTFDQQHNLDPNSYSGQLGFLVWFVPRQSWWTQFNAAPTPQDAALWFQNGYEHCSGAGQSGTDQTGSGLCNPANRMAQAAAASAATGTTVPVSYTPTSSTGYVNPFSQAQGLVPERVDMGVDYNAQAGSPILAIGDGRVIGAASGGTGWRSPENTQAAVYYQLASGAEAGKFVYVAEDIIPTVKTGDTITAGQQIAMFKASSTGLETGWGTGMPYGALATTTGGYTEGQVTAAGVSFSAFLQSLGAPPGTMSATPVGALPAGYPTSAAPSGSSTSGCASATVSAVSPVIGHPTHCDFYLSPTGSDSNSGATPTEAWRTIDHLVSTLPSGKTGCLESGTYGSSSDLWNITRTNTTITAAPGAAVTIKGAPLINYPYTGNTISYLNIDLNCTNQSTCAYGAGEGQCPGSTYEPYAFEIDANNTTIVHDNVYQTDVPALNRSEGLGLGWNPNPSTHTVTGLTIAYNRIHDVGTNCRKGHGIYDAAVDHSSIYDNWIWGIDQGGACIQLYDGFPLPVVGPHDQSIYSNVCDDVSQGFFLYGQTSYYQNITMQHNIIRHTTQYGGFAANSGTNSTIQFINNDGTNISDGWPCGSSGGCGSVSTGGNVSVDPMFVNAAAHDYRLLPNSPLASWSLWNGS